MSSLAAPYPFDEMIGRTLLSRYRVVRKLAEGGMGVVYLARAEGAAGFIKPVVLKLILHRLSAQPQFLGMFVREAQILAQLRHPGIVDVIEFGEQDGAYIMVLEYVAGYQLREWSAYLASQNRNVPSEICCQLVTGVLDALQHVHRQALPDGKGLGIIHRDVSPSNILLGIEGYAKLVDFGVARMEVDTLYRTTGGGFRGKLAYSAPELFQGGEATPQSDIYSCGVVLHELLIGRNAFAGVTQAETLQRALNHVPESVHAVRDDAPEEIDAILARALAKAPQDRFATAGEFASALQKTQRSTEPQVREQLASLLRVDFGDAMAAQLGVESLARRDRAWRRFSLPPASMTALPGDALFERAQHAPGAVREEPTRALSPGLAPDEPTLGYEDFVNLIARAAETAQSARAAEEASSSAIGRARRMLPWAIALLCVLFAGGALWWSQRLPLAPAAGRILLVESENAEAAPQKNEPAAEPVPSAAAEAPAEAAGSGAPPLKPAAVAVVTPKRVVATPANGGQPNPAELTRAFRRNQKRVEDCVGEHSAQLQGQPQLEILFHVDASGRAERAALIPESLDATPLGACLRKVALATRFPVHGEALSFRIPVTTRRVTLEP